MHILIMVKFVSPVVDTWMFWNVSIEFNLSAMAFSLENKSLGNFCSNFSSNDMSLDFLSYHFLNTTFDLIAMKANGQWLVLLFFNYHRWLTVKQIIN